MEDAKTALSLGECAPVTSGKLATTPLPHSDHEVHERLRAVRTIAHVPVRRPPVGQDDEASRPATALQLEHFFYVDVPKQNPVVSRGDEAPAVHLAGLLREVRLVADL